MAISARDRMPATQTNSSATHCFDSRVGKAVEEHANSVSSRTTEDDYDLANL
jgi:hypothetical protein